jgi:aconitate hydratase
MTREFLRLQGRESDWMELKSDSEDYDETLVIDLSKVVSLAAKPHSPDNVSPVSELAGTEVNQVCIGSCTNSSLEDLMTVSSILKGKKVHPKISLTISPGSKQVYEALARSGALAELIASGARILESACGPCIGMGQSPPSGGVSLRTFNRNFEGRSGTKDAKVYLVSPEVAAFSALTGKITLPGDMEGFKIPKISLDDSGIIEPSGNGKVIRGPNIAPLPLGKPIERKLAGEILIKVGDNISTDHIMPAGAKVLPFRSNIPKISEFVFSPLDPTFASRAKQKGGFILAGENYGQGSSREHAAIAPMYLGVRAVLAKSFARIHKANLINFGIVPMEFQDPNDYDKLSQGDSLELDFDNREITNKGIKLRCDLSPRQENILKAGGLLNLIKDKNA